MFRTYLEAIDKNYKYTVAFTGRFGPFHNGHLKAYTELVNKFGKESVHVLTSDPKAIDERNPFPFSEKKKMMVAAGIPESNAHQLKGSGYNVEHIMNSIGNVNPNSVFIAAVSDEDFKNRFIKYMGEKHYYTDTWKDQQNPKMSQKNGYVYVVKALKHDTENKVSASDIRTAIKKQDLKSVKNDLPIGVYNYLVKTYTESILFNKDNHNKYTEEHDDFKATSPELKYLISGHNRLNDNLLALVNNKVDLKHDIEKYNRIRKEVIDLFNALKERFPKLLKIYGLKETDKVKQAKSIMDPLTLFTGQEFKYVLDHTTKKIKGFIEYIDDRERIFVYIDAALGYIHDVIKAFKYYDKGGK